MICMHVRDSDVEAARAFLQSLVTPARARVMVLEHKNPSTVEQDCADGDDLLDTLKVAKPSFPFSAFCAHPSPGYDECGAATIFSLTVFDGTELITVPADALRWPLIPAPPRLGSAEYVRAKIEYDNAVARVHLLQEREEQLGL